MDQVGWLLHYHHQPLLPPQCPPHPPILPHHCQEAALTRRIAWRRSGGGVGLGPSGKQLHPAAPELTAWRERPADSSQ